MPMSRRILVDLRELTDPVDAIAAKECNPHAAVLRSLIAEGLYTRAKRQQQEAG